MVSIIFIASLLITFVTARLVAHSLHDRQNYGTPYEMSKTITGWLRKKTGFNLHHYHFGIIIILIALLLGSYSGFSNWVIALSGVGMSLFFDQISFFVYSRGNYFEREYFSARSLATSMLFHLIAMIAAIFA